MHLWLLDTSFIDLKANRQQQFICFFLYLFDADAMIYLKYDEFRNYEVNLSRYINLPINCI